MATDKKHIAVYLEPEIEQALIAFCEHKGLKSKKGFMYSAGVNAALATFFGVSAESDVDNIPETVGNIPAVTSTIPNQVASNIPAVTSTIPNQVASNIPAVTSTIPNQVASNIPNNIPAKSIDVGVMPGKFRA